MSTTYKVLLWKLLKDGTHKVKIRVTVARQQEYIETGVALPARYWNPEADPLQFNWVRPGHPDRKLLNGRLREVLQEVQKWVLDGTPRPARELKQLVEARFRLGRAGGAAAPVAQEITGQHDALVYFRDELTRREGMGYSRTTTQMRYVMQKIQAYLAPVELLGQSLEERAAVLATVRLPWAALTSRWVRDYAEHLTGLGNKPSTILMNLGYFKTVLKRAAQDGYLPEGAALFQQLGLRKNEPQPKFKLTAGQVQQLEELALPVSTRSKREIVARDAWLLQYYLLGSRVGDVLLLRWGDVQAHGIQFREQKTNKSKFAPMHPRLRALLARLAPLAPQQPPHPEDFILPLLRRGAPYARFPAQLSWHELSRKSDYQTAWRLLIIRLNTATANLNRGLRLLTPLLGVPAGALTSHTARHSFANVGRISGLPTAHLRDLLNHSSVSVTEFYMGQLAQDDTQVLAQRIYES